MKGLKFINDAQWMLLIEADATFCTQSKSMATKHIIGTVFNNTMISNDISTKDVYKCYLEKDLHRLGAGIFRCFVYGVVSIVARFSRTSPKLRNLPFAQM